MSVLFLIYLFSTVFADDNTVNVKCPKKEETTNLKHVFVLFLQPQHEAINYQGGLKVKAEDEYWNPFLSNMGRKTAYESGKCLVETYGENLGLNGDKFLQGQYTGYGTGSKMSYHAVLTIGAGLRREVQENIKNWTDDELNKVKNYDNKIDMFMIPAGSDLCKKFTTHLENVKTKLKDIVGGKNNLILQYIHASIKGLSKDKIEELKALETDIMDPFKLFLGHETLIMMKKSRQTNHLPKWATEEAMGHMKTISQEFLYQLVFSDDNVKKLIAVKFINDLLETMEAMKENGKDTNLKIPIDEKSKITYFVSSLPAFAAQISAFSPSGTKFNGNVFTKETFYPEQGAMLTIVLYKDETNHVWKVKVLYKKEYDKETLPLTQPGCDENGICDFEKFKQNIEKIKIENEDALEKECENDPTRT